MTFGYNPAGPVLTVSQVAAMVGTPGFQTALKRVIDLEGQAMSSDTGADAAPPQSQHSPSQR